MLVVPLRASCPLTVKNHRVRSPRDTSACRAPPAEGSHIQLRSVAQPLTHKLGSPRDKRVRDLYSWRPWGKAWQQLKLTDSIWKQRSLQGHGERKADRKWLICLFPGSCKAWETLFPGNQRSGVSQRVLLAPLHHTHLACWKRGFGGHKHNESKSWETGIYMLDKLVRQFWCSLRFRNRKFHFPETVLASSSLDALLISAILPISDS